MEGTAGRHELAGVGSCENYGMWAGGATVSRPFSARRRYRPGVRLVARVEGDGGQWSELGEGCMYQKLGEVRRKGVSRPYRCPASRFDDHAGVLSRLCLAMVHP